MSGPAESPRTDFPPVRACIFDMDGLLINSEDIYTHCTNLVLREFGRSDLPWDIKAQLQGRPGPEAGAIFHEWAKLPISRSDYLEKIAALQREHFPSAKPLPGVPELLRTLTERTRPRVHIALATSSQTANFKAKTAHLQDIFSRFPPDQTVLGDNPRIPRGRGKPAPDIYRVALHTINEGIRRRRQAREGDASSGTNASNDKEQEQQEELEEEAEIKPEECLVFEDSVPGVEAGRRAGMRVIWVPHPGLLKEYRGREKLVLAGQMETLSHVDRGQHLAAEVGVDVHGKQDGRTTGNEERATAGDEGEARTDDEVKPKANEDNDEKGEKEETPGQIDDGWAEILHSLEDFDPRLYGISVKLDQN